MAETEKRERFTPGPWHPGHLGDLDTTCECRSVVDEGYAGGIATVHLHNGIQAISDGGNDAPPREEAIANMHLIAAAPDLYEALDACEAAMSIVMPRSNTAQYREVLMQAREALAKARGETTEGLAHDQSR